MSELTLVERLNADHVGQDHGILWNLCDEAADEIERLEAKWRSEGDAFIDAKAEIERLSNRLRVEEENAERWAGRYNDARSRLDSILACIDANDVKR